MISPAILLNQRISHHRRHAGVRQRTTAETSIQPSFYLLALVSLLLRFRQLLHLKLQRTQYVLWQGVRTAESDELTVAGQVPMGV